MLKKIIILISIFFSFLVLVFLAYFVFKRYSIVQAASKCMIDDINTFSKKNDEVIFSIDKIVYFSSANANVEINPNSSFTVSNLFQYTDIALFINNHANGNFTSKNTLKTVTLSDINYILKPTIGEQKLFYKNLNDFATDKYEEKNLIDGSLIFQSSSDDAIDYSTPVLYNNCANPITLCYINSNLKPNYTLPVGTSNIIHNGSLLKSCNITLNSLSCKIEFLVTIENNENELYTCPIILNLPLSTEKSTVYDGSLTLNNEANYTFIQKSTI